MAASMSDVSPLLNETNGEELPPKNRVLGKFGECIEQNVTRRLQIRGDFLSSKKAEEEGDVVSIFVVTFDTKSGNTVEWSLPEGNDLDGVEFKSMPSGAHTTVSDFTYFRMDNQYGLSCFAKMSVDSEAERGARMKSVGLLSTSYTNLYKHMQFLESQVRIQLETPGRYDQLAAFFYDHLSFLPTTYHNGASGRDTTDADSECVSVISARSDHFLPHMKITHPAGCFSQFINFFSENIFTLWKYVLLRRRILFFSPPPIGVVCFRVYCACMLGQYEVELDTTPELKPFFYINIADIETLETELSYVACTTEKIFQEKKTLYDVYVDNQDITTHIPRFKDMAKVNKMDREKFNFLNNQRCAQMFRAQEMGDDDVDDDHLFSTFFTEQNNHIFQTLLDAAKSVDKTITSEHMRDMGLDPVADRQFLMDLLELYGIDVILMVDNPCCPV